jgi:hypothetical protein
MEVPALEQCPQRAVSVRSHWGENDRLVDDGATITIDIPNRSIQSVSTTTYWHSAARGTWRQWLSPRRSEPAGLHRITRLRRHGTVRRQGAVRDVTKLEA